MEFSSMQASQFSLLLGVFMTFFVIESSEGASNVFCTKEIHTSQHLIADKPPPEALYGSMRLSQLWAVKELKIHFMNPNVLAEDNWTYRGFQLNPAQILDWVDPWNKNSKFYPIISLDPIMKEQQQDAHIRVWFDSSKDTVSWSLVGNDALDPNYRRRATMSLSLLHLDDKAKKSNVIHEFGHVLGLDHEHQRSNFWDILGQKEGDHYRFIIGKENMRNGIGGCQKAGDQFFRSKTDTPINETEQSEYDPNSIMHYWFDIKWLKPEYQDKRSPEYAKLTSEERRIIDGVHQRDYSHGYLVDEPSDEDYRVLNRAYNRKRVVSEHSPSSKKISKQKNQPILKGTVVKKDDRPRMTDLLSFKLRKDTIDITNEIGTDYEKFGVLLLGNANKVDNIKKSNQYQVKDIVVQIIKVWLKGSGKTPVTWETFVWALKESGLAVLASDIESQYSQEYVHEEL